MAAKTAFIRARIDPILKNEVETMFHNWGITTTQAIDMFYKQIKRTHKFPLDLSYNSETNHAIRNAKLGRGVKTSKNSNDMFKALGISNIKGKHSVRRITKLKRSPDKSQEKKSL